jgi:hypothetical protein
MSIEGYFDVPYFTSLFIYQQLMYTFCELITLNMLIHVSVENKNIIINCGLCVTKL